jgi:hypothetical protein
MRALRWLIWALLKNDDAGPYGPENEHTAWGAIRWWLRNPFHNLCWHVLAKEGGWFFQLGGVPGWWFYIGHRPWTSPPGAFGIKLTYEQHKV